MENLKNKKIKIEDGRIYLKTLSEKNATKEYCSWLNNPEVNKYIMTKNATIAGLKKYIEKNNRDPNCLFLGIFFKKNEKPNTGNSILVRDSHIGNIKLDSIDFKNRRATTGILIGNKDYWGKGIGTQAITLLVDYGFKNLNLKDIHLGVVSENKGAIRVYEKASFKVDRTDKKSVHNSEKLIDIILMSIKNENDKNQK